MKINKTRIRIKRIVSGEYKTEDNRYTIKNEWYRETEEGNYMLYWNIYNEGKLIRNCESLTDAKEYINKKYEVKKYD